MDLWTNLPLSLIGRINLIKINLLPRLNYLFQSLPCPIPTLFFKELNTEMSKFLWNRKKAWVSLATLCKPCKEGGLALPNFELYYWSAQIKRIIEWFQEIHGIILQLSNSFEISSIYKQVPFIRV